MKAIWKVTDNKVVYVEKLRENLLEIKINILEVNLYL